MKAIPFLSVKLKGRVSAHYKGVPILGTDVDLNLVLTEDNVAQVIEQATPLIMALASQVGNVLAKKVAQAEQEDTDPISQLLRRLRAQRDARKEE